MSKLRIALFVFTVLLLSIVAFNDAISQETSHPVFKFAGDVYSIDPIVHVMRYAPHECFIQGSPNDEPCRNSDEAVFTHELTGSLAVMETEITRQMWTDLRTFYPDLPSDKCQAEFSPDRLHPVQRVSWFEAILVANLLSEQNHLIPCYYRDDRFSIPLDLKNFSHNLIFCNFDANGYRLPTKAEWEHFCRAGTSGAFSCPEPGYSTQTCDACDEGLLSSLDCCCHYCTSDIHRTIPAGSKLANPWGLKDIHGNVWECCWDWYAPYPGGSQINYTGPSSGAERVIRGGGWGKTARECRSAERHCGPPAGRGAGLGFRLVRSAI